MAEYIVGVDKKLTDTSLDPRTSLWLLHMILAKSNEYHCLWYLFHEISMEFVFEDVQVFISSYRDYPVFFFLYERDEVVEENYETMEECFLNF